MSELEIYPSHRFAQLYRALEHVESKDEAEKMERAIDEIHEWCWTAWNHRQESRDERG